MPCLLLSALVGCALPAPRSATEPDNLAFLSEAIRASNSGREAMWRTLDATPDMSEHGLRMALLRSLPGHQAYDPGAAMKELRAYTESSDANTAALAQVRLAALNQASRCWTEIDGLQRRLDAIADIERQLDTGQ